MRKESNNAEAAQNSWPVTAEGSDQMDAKDALDRNGPEQIQILPGKVVFHLALARLNIPAIDGLPTSFILAILP